MPLSLHRHGLGFRSVKMHRIHAYPREQPLHTAALGHPCLPPTLAFMFIQLFFRLFLLAKSSLILLLFHREHGSTRATRRTVAEIDREFDELASALSDPREELITSGERTSWLCPSASQADNTSDPLDSDVAMDENIQINSAAHNTEGPETGECMAYCYASLEGYISKG